MSNGPGPPVSPHGDSGPYEPRARSDPYRSDGGDTEREGVSSTWYRQTSGSAGTRTGPPSYAPPDSGDGRGQADGTAALRGQTQSSLTPLVGLRPASDRGTEISRGSEPMKIGIWGSPLSGKSTFLAALQHATLNAHRSLGQWNLIPLTKQSTDLLVRWNDDLVTQRKFPEATYLGAEAELRWRFRGDLAGSKFQPTWRRLQRTAESSAFDLDLIDVSGEVFSHNPTEKNVPQDVVDRTLNHLANAQGLIFLFDPITERDIPGVEKYLNRPLAELASLVERTRGMTARGRMPHHISVCVTKFDEPRLFREACRTGFVNSGRDGIPRVLDKHARLLFEALCDGTFWPEPDPRGTHGPQFVRGMLEKHFDSARIRYYVTSSIGFNLAADGRFDPGHYSMVRNEEGGKRRIIGSIKPINVLEPLVELHMRLRGGR